MSIKKLFDKNWVEKNSSQYYYLSVAPEGHFFRKEFHEIQDFIFKGSNLDMSVTKNKIIFKVFGENKVIGSFNPRTKEEEQNFESIKKNPDFQYCRIIDFVTYTKGGKTKLTYDPLTVLICNIKKESRKEIKGGCLGVVMFIVLLIILSIVII